MLPTGWSWPIRSVICCADAPQEASASADAVRTAEMRFIGSLLRVDFLA
jgi:hypothetical protein